MRLTHAQLLEKDILFHVEGLKTYFPIKKGFLKRTVGYVKAVDGVSFSIKQGETLGICGESGCGKTTVARSILKLIPSTAGKIQFKTNLLSEENNSNQYVSINDIDRNSLRTIRQELAYIFQDPESSLNPRMRVGDIIAEPLIVSGRGNSFNDFEDEIIALMKSVGLHRDDILRLPHEFSGGQRQRIGIARALISNPKLVVCDEPTSALDVSVQGQIINLMKDLHAEYNLTYMFISHNLSVIQHISDRVAIMYLGRIVEMGDVDKLFFKPTHPYTEALLSSIQTIDPDYERERIILKGEVPSSVTPPEGCYFHPRCSYATGECTKTYPELKEIGEDYYSACHHAAALNLKGIN